MKTFLKGMLFTLVMGMSVFAVPADDTVQVVFTQDDLKIVVDMGRAVKKLQEDVDSLQSAYVGNLEAASLDVNQKSILGSILNGLGYVLRSKQAIELIGIAVLAGGMNTKQGIAISQWVKNSLTETYGFVGTSLWNVVLTVRYMVYDLPFKRDIEPFMKKLSTWSGRIEIATYLLLGIEAYCVATDKTGPTVKVLSGTANLGNGAYNLGTRAYTNSAAKIRSLRTPKDA